VTLESLEKVLTLRRKGRAHPVHSEDMIKVQLYGKQDCHLCLVARETLFRVREHVPFEFQEIDIESGKDLYADFREKIPVVFIDGKRTFTHRVNETRLVKILNNALATHETSEPHIVKSTIQNSVSGFKSV
jgi:glutaredoxin